MADRDGEKFYWLKLYGDLFTSKRIKKLRKLGADFFIIYLKMQLISLKTNGYIRFDGVEESLAEEIALEIDEDEDKVQVTISYLQACGLMECTDNNEYFLPYVEKCTGSETRGAERVRRFREKQKNEALQCNVTVTEVKPECNLEKEIEKEKELEIEKESKHKHGAYAHVLLKDSEYEKLISDYGHDLTEEAITFLDEYIEMKGTKYKSHYLALRKWVFDAVKERKGKSQGIDYDEMRNWV